ncbi:protease [Pedobacter sp. UBA5917]|uniref:protease n=1 Tax=Pedobacter sp. UBA5917 TaxID=1947061 RepID=UPI0025E09BB8|nr:protease [Pedobacter sp. UBA5917]
MLKLKLIIPAVLIVLAGCSQKVHNTTSNSASESKSDSLYVVLKIKDIIKTGEKVTLNFTIHNDQSTEKSFCKWHTPFEPLMSKYLDIKDENGNEASYKGPMAKRIMPPPADSYLIIKPEDILSSEVDLLKAYQLEAGKKYTVSYNSSSISGVKATNTVTFRYTK